MIGRTEHNSAEHSADTQVICPSCDVFLVILLDLDNWMGSCSAPKVPKNIIKTATDQEHLPKSFKRSSMIVHSCPFIPSWKDIIIIIIIINVVNDGYIKL